MPEGSRRNIITPRYLHVALDDLVASALETIDTYGRVLAIDLPDDLPLIETDPDLAERVIANVVSNACRFGSTRPTDSYQRGHHRTRP